jgi:hypothetical protein
VRWLLLTAAFFTACRSQPVDVKVGDPAPLRTQAGGHATVLFVTGLDDLLDCPFQDALVALRSAQRAGANGAAVTALLVTRNAGDTLAFSRALQRERISPRIETISPAEARRSFDLARIPAIYLIEDGRVAREWEQLDRTVPAIRRNEIADALAQVSKRR